MKPPDWDEEPQGFCEQEAFNNTFLYVGEKTIHFLFDNRSRYWPALDDSAFLPILDMVRQVLDQFLFPDHLAELWDYACWVYHEYRKESMPRITGKKCELEMQQSLPNWYKVVSEARQAKGKKKRK